MIVTTDFLPNVSGIATLSYEQTKGLADLGHDILVLTATAGAKQWSKQAGASFEVREHITELPPIIRLQSLIRFVAKSVNEWKPDFIWCSNYRGFGLPVMTISKTRNVPYGMYFHGTELVTENKNFFRHRILKKSITSATITCVNSHSTASLLKKIYGLNTICITPGVDTPPELTPEFLSKAEAIRQAWLHLKPSEISDKNRVIFISSSRISRQKGIQRIIESISLLKPDVRNRVLYVVGGRGPAVAEFQQLAATLGVENNVLFNGMALREDLPAVLKAADVYIQPSQPEEEFLEGYGISFLEAQAVGLPCIASDWCGTPEAVLRDVTALLVPPGSTEAILQAMNRVVADKQWRENAALQGPLWAALNSWKKHANALEALIAAKKNDS